MEAPVSEISRYGLVALFLLAVAFVFAAPLFWQHAELPDVRTSESYKNSDLYEFVLPSMHFAYGRLRAGEIPLWNSRQMCGTPLQADHRLGLFQPLNAVFLHSPTERAMALHSFICLALMGFGFVLFARSLELAYTAALIGGIVYAFSGASAAAMSRPYLASALAWLPFLFWTLREFARFGHRGWAPIAGLVLAAFIFAGANALAALVIPLAAAYLMLHGFTGRQGEFGLRTALRGLLLAGFVGVGLSAVQWIPTLAWAREMDTPSRAVWYLRTGGYLPGSLMEALVQTFTARPGDLPRLFYVGMVPLILAPAALFQRKHWRETALFGLAGLGAWLVGATGPQRVFFGLPREAFVFVAVFCIAVLTALGADRLLKPRTDYHSPKVWPVMFVVFPVLAGVFYVAGSQGRGYVIAFTAVLVPYLALRKRWFSLLLGCAAALLVFVDLTVASVNAYGHPYQDFHERFGRYRESIDIARERALGGRAVVMSRSLEYGLPGNLGMVAPIDTVGGRSLFATREQAAWWAGLKRRNAGIDAIQSWDVSPEASESALLNFMTARVVLASPEANVSADMWGAAGPRLREIQTPVRAYIFVNESALPRAFWIPAWRLVDSVESAVDAMTAPGFDPARECVVMAAHGPFLERFLERQPSPVDVPRTNAVAAAPHEIGGDNMVQPAAASGRPLASRPPASSCSLEEVSPEHLVIHVEASQPGIVVLSDTFDRGWRATLNGGRSEILQVNGIFRGIAVPAGSHEIVFRYRPASLFLGLAGSLLGAAVFFGSLLAAVFQRH